MSNAHINTTITFQIIVRTPNLTTTQPILNMVGIDTIIAVPTTHPPHTHTNSTATKFRMQPHLTILTTTKHNLIPLFSWGKADLPLG